ncbi:MAG TPA: 6-bladed beta-propeller, partial [Spirochaetia bacterium]|nr:6-bladed beta-propeller [Spirochaetia bacterium]
MKKCASIFVVSLTWLFALGIAAASAQQMGAASDWKTFGSAGTGANQLSGPVATATDSRGRIYVVDQGNSRIVRFDNMSGANWVTFGSYGSGVDHFSGPTGIAVDGRGRVYVADPENNR